MRLAFVWPYQGETITGFGNLGTPGTNAQAADRFAGIISTTLGAITIIGGVYFIFQIITGAVQWISAGSDKDGVSKAQKKFTNSIIGLVILLFSYSLVGVIGTLIGFDIFHFSTLLDNIAL